MAASVRRRSLGEGIALEDPLMPPFTMPLAHSFGTAGLGTASSKVYALSPPDSSLTRRALAAICRRGPVNVLLWRLCFVGVLLGGASKSIAGWCFHSYCHSPSRVPPLGWRRMAVRGARMCCRCRHQLQRRPSCPIKLWFACPSPLLVPIPLGGPSDGGRQWSGVATRSGVGMHWS